MIIRILNPHGLSIMQLWPTLRSVDVSFKDAMSFIEGQALKISSFRGLILESILKDLGRSVRTER